MPRKNKPPKAPESIEQYFAEKDEARFRENQELARTLRTVRSALSEREKELEELKGRTGLYEQLDAARLEPPKWLTPARSSKVHHGIPALLLTDVHWGEVVQPEQVGGLNKYNTTIAALRLKQCFERAVRISRDYMAGVKYDGFALLLGGDILSGIIHEELRETNQEAVTASVLGAAEHIAAGVMLLAESFPKVYVAAVAGNHGRLTRKPRSKGKATESLDWLVYQMVRKELQANDRVTMDVATAADHRFALYNTRFVLTHGDQFRGGHGISAELSPLLLGVHRKQRRDAAAGQPFDVLLMGHFHRSHFLHDVIVGGSIVGYSEYAFDKNLMYQVPQATLFLTTPERGITMYSPVFVQDKVAEGWG